MRFLAINNLQSVSASLKAQKKLLLLIGSSDDCAFCVQLKEEFLKPIFINQQYLDKALVRELFINRTNGSFFDFDGKEVDISVLIQRYGIIGTPTMAFLDDRGQVLHDPIFGIATPDFFFHTIENAIDSSYTRL